MGCCCNKQKTEEDAEREPLVNGGDSTQFKSRFYDHSSHNQNSLNYNTNIANSSGNGNGYNSNININDQNLQNINLNGSNSGGSGGAGGNNYSENNQLFDKILNDVILVSTIDQRINTNLDATNQLIQVQDMPIKIKGLLEPTKNQLSLPEGVVAPLVVLAAQPPFSNDIKLISNFAQEANNCYNNYALQVPTNVAFNFNPVA